MPRIRADKSVIICVSLLVGAFVFLAASPDMLRVAATGGTPKEQELPVPADKGYIILDDEQFQTGREYFKPFDPEPAADDHRK